MTRFRQVYEWPDTIELSAGASDSINAYKFKDGYAFLSVNRRIGYVGFELYMKEDMETMESIWEPRSSLFFQYDWELENAFGKKALSRSPRWLLRRIMDKYEDIVWGV